MKSCTCSKQYLHRLIGLLLTLLFTLTHIAYAADVPPPAEAHVFKPNVKRLDPNTLLVSWKIQGGNFLYKDRLKFAVPDSLTMGPLRLPSAHQSKQSDGKTFDIYRQKVEVPLAILANGKGEHWLAVTHQGCSDGGFCYPPVTRCYTIITDNEGGISKITPDAFPNKLSMTAMGMKRLQGNPAPMPVESLFHTHHPFWLVLSFFGFGLLLSLTPCVLPMVPVLSSIILSQGRGQNKTTALILSLGYIVGMGLAYATIGVVVSLLGQNLQTTLQTPLALGLFSLLYFVLGLSLLDAFDLRLPSSWQSGVSSLNTRLHGGRLLGVIVMGALSTLVLSPCVTAPLVGALGYLSAAGSPLLGGVALFSFGVGLGVPLLLIGISTQLLPKTGVWMTLLKHCAGFMLIGVAIYTLGRLLHPQLAMLSWSVLLLYIGFYALCGGPKASAYRLLGFVLSALCVISAVLLLVGIALDHHDLQHPLRPIMAPSTRALSQEKQVTTVTTLPQLQQALGAYSQYQTPVMLDFYASWCVSCKHIERHVLNAPVIRKAMETIGVIRIDVTKRNQDSRALEKAYNVVAPPTLIFIDGQGQEKQRLVGETTVSTLLETLNAIPNVNANVERRDVGR